jgi:hypothetical protein
MSLISPYDVLSSNQGLFPFDLYERKCLAQGDSWFSIGALPPGRTTNLLQEMRLLRSVATVNCARPGKELAHMADTSTEPMFLRLLTGRSAWRWDAILLSGFGNDAIDAASVPPAQPAALRLLATATERGGTEVAADAYFSVPGWQTFEAHMGAVFHQLLDLRDGGVNRDTPLVLHNYHALMPSMVGAGLGFGPWVEPSLRAFEVPAQDHDAVAAALMARLDDLMRRLITARLAAGTAGPILLVDTQAVAMDLAAADASGPSGDFVNEIHPSQAGYAKLAQPWSQLLDQLL